MASVCLGKTTCQKWMARLHVRGVRACVHALSPSQQRLIPSRSHRNDGSLWAVEFSDHVQILPWASPSQYSQNKQYILEKVRRVSSVKFPRREGGSIDGKKTRSLVAVEPRRPPMTDVGTETAFRQQKSDLTAHA